MRSRVVALAFLLLALLGCNGANPGTRITQPPSPNHTFYVYVQNNTLWELELGTATSLSTGQTGTVTIPSGDHATFLFSSVPQAISVTAATTSLPQIFYPTQTQYLGVDYTNATPSTSFGIP